MSMMLAYLPSSKAANCPVGARLAGGQSSPSPTGSLDSSGYSSSGSSGIAPTDCSRRNDIRSSDHVEMTSDRSRTVTRQHRGPMPDVRGENRLVSSSTSSHQTRSRIIDKHSTFARSSQNNSGIVTSGRSKSVGRVPGQLDWADSRRGIPGESPGSCGVARFDGRTVVRKGEWSQLGQRVSSPACHPHPERSRQDTGVYEEREKSEATAALGQARRGGNRCCDGQVMSAAAAATRRGDGTLHGDGRAQSAMLDAGYLQHTASTHQLRSSGSTSGNGNKENYNTLVSTTAGQMLLRQYDVDRQGCVFGLYGKQPGEMSTHPQLNHPQRPAVTPPRTWSRVRRRPNGTVYQDGHGGLVTIRMKPDTQGRFGFNVKGGADQNMPIIVSRVAPNTPADVCIPRLNEGDQVLFINGRDVSQHKHEQVVQFIRASRETHSGELVLVVRPNVYIGEDTGDEPDFQYIPDTHHITTSLPPGGDPLAGSLLLLQEGLESGAALAQFEQLYRKKPGMTMNCARQMENTPKNRYRDISPYDQTRVKIKGPTSDYINANYVNMEIQGSGIVNRYIAAQGPLPHTSSDFWQMVWDQHSSVVVMLTTKVERGRVKCHQYWPDMYETTIFGPLQVTCLKEEKTASFAFREFTLVNPEHNNEERHIRHMQYIAWPDHGVPDDSQDFLDFVMRVRANRDGMVEPTIVHCSAGIGRTGVLITMETAMCLIEANQPVYPLDMVRHMRDQRAMLIQTSSQYKFVCEAIMRVYNEKIVVPQEDYKR